MAQFFTIIHVLILPAFGIISSAINILAGKGGHLVIQE